jgi:hypothetical protein
VYAALGEADPDVLDRDELAALTQQVAELRAWCDSVQVRITRRQRVLAADGRAESPRDLLTRDGRHSGRDARTADDRERVCSSLPSFEDALAAGTVSAGHVDAIAQVTRNLDAAAHDEFLAMGSELLADAERYGVDIFQRNCRELARHLSAVHAHGSDVEELERQRLASTIRRWTDRETGMRHTLVSLDPVRDRAFWTAVTDRRGRLRHQPGNRSLTWEQLEVEALVAAIGGGDGERRVPSICVLVDYDSLCDGLTSSSLCETDDATALPVATVRRLCCEAEIIPIVLDGHGQALDVGRAARVATPAQRLALRAMHRTCIHPHCTVPFEDCHVHHVVPWYLGGRSDIDNLAPLCNEHHHLVHEGGWTLTLASDRIATWTRPDGVVDHTGPTIDRGPDRPDASDGHHSTFALQLC